MLTHSRFLSELRRTCTRSSDSIGCICKGGYFSEWYILQIQKFSSFQSFSFKNMFVCTILHLDTVKKTLRFCTCRLMLIFLWGYASSVYLISPLNLYCEFTSVYTQLAISELRVHISKHTIYNSFHIYTIWFFLRIINKHLSSLLQSFKNKLDCQWKKK